MANTSVVQLKKARPKGESLWQDAFRRLIRNRAAMLGLVILLLAGLGAIFADRIATRDYATQVLVDNNSSPYWVTRLFPVMRPRDEGGYVKIDEDYLLGTDALGRDLFSRIIYGSRVSLAVAIVGPFFSIVIGLILGLIAGYVGGRTDEGIMRLVDVMYAFPTLLLIILLMAFFRSSFAQEAEPGTFTYWMGRADAALGGMLFIFIGVGVTSWMQMARLTRAQVLAVREREYILAAHSLGASDWRIVLQHVLPNILGPLIVAETLTIPTYISFEAFLSFIGLGVNPPTPSWGAMISQGASVISTYPSQALFPALALFLVMFAFNFLGDGLRDAFDPRMRGTD
jgi:oligopeptide transport system permease protein